MTATWTRDETIARRAQWNASIKAGEANGKNGKVDPRLLKSLETRLGFSMTALVAAVNGHDLDGKRAAESPAVTLRRERERLADAVAGLRDEQEETFHRLHAGQDMSAWSSRLTFEHRIDAAVAQLNIFDAEHPEVLATIKAERAADHAQSFAARGLD